MIEGVVIAAGRSTRTGGRNKLTLPLDGHTVIHRSVSCLMPFCDRIYVVTGHRENEVVEALPDCPDVIIVYNSNYDDGMFSSILMGFGKVEADYCFLLPGDCPFVDRKAIKGMLERPRDILVPRYHSKPGHPVLLSRQMISKLLSGKGYASLRAFIEANNPEYVDVDSPGILLDIDTMEDYSSAKTGMCDFER